MKRVVAPLLITLVLALIPGSSAIHARKQSRTPYFTEPLWSPDESTLMFAANPGGSLDVFTVAADGSGLRSVACSDSTDYSADWSPDGKHIAFTSTRAGESAVFVTELATGRVARVSPAGMPALQGVWSPDGERIAFRGFDDRTDPNGANIWTVAPDGSGAKAVTLGRNRFEGADWSPDGTRILATVNVDRSTALLKVIPVNGSPVTTVTTPQSGSAHGGSWSPDGKRIAFYSSVSGNFEVYVMNADGTAITNVTNHPSRDFVSQWKRDGRHVVIWSNRDPAGGGGPNRQQTFYEVDVTDGSTRRLMPTDRFDFARVPCLEKARR